MKIELNDIQNFFQNPDLIKSEIICEEERDEIIEELNEMTNEISLYQFIQLVGDIVPEVTMDIVYYLAEFLDTGKVSI